MSVIGVRRFACALAVAASAVSPLSAAAAAPGEARVVAAFEVGDDVHVRALKVEAKANALWVGTSVGALEIDLESTRARNTFTRKDGLANEYVFAIGIDAQGYKWFGTNAGGASRYKDGRWKTYFPMHGLADYWVYSFASDRAGRLWIGTWAGVSVFDPKNGKFRTYVRELVNEWVYGLSVDANGRVWMATEGGVSMYDGKRWRAWTHADGVGRENRDALAASVNTGLGTRSRHDLTTQVDGLPSYNPNYVFAIHAARDGAIWAGTWGGGVARYDGRRWTNFSRGDGLAGNIVYAIAEGPDGVLWFGTDQGVSRYDGAAWQTIGRAEGLLEANVYALAAAPNGDVWAGSRRGVVRIAMHGGEGR